MKKIVALFISFILIFSLVVPSYANLIDGLKEVQPSTQLGEVTIDTGELDNLSNANPSEDGGNTDWWLQMIIDLFDALAGILTAPIRALIFDSSFTIEGAIWAKSPYFQLTFFNDNALYQSDSSTTYSVATSFKSLIASVYNGLRYLVAAIYVIILVYLGIRMLLSSIGRQKAHYKALLQYWFTGLLLLFAFHWVMAFMIWGSYQLTDMFATLGETAINNGSNVIDYTTSGFAVTEFIIVQIGKLHTTTLFTLFGLIFAAIGYLILLIIGVKISLMYLKRLFTIAMLIVLFPAVVLCYVFDKIGDRKSQTFSWWMKEFTVNVFIQPLHAFILALIACMLGSVVIFQIPFVGAILSLLSLSLISVLEKQFKSIFQIESSMGPGHGGFAHQAAHFGMAMQTLKNLGGSAIKTVGAMKHLKKAEELEALQKNKADEKRKKVYKNSLKKLKEEHPDWSQNKLEKQAKEDSDKAYNEAYDKLTNDADYKKRMKELTGHTSLDKAQNSMNMKLFSGIAGGIVGIPQALLGAQSLGKLFPDMLSKITSNAAVAGSIASMGTDLMNTLKDKTDSPELDHVKALLGQDPKNWSKEDKKRISSVCGVDINNLDKIDESTVNLLKRKVDDREEALKFGITFDNPETDLFDQDSDELDELRRFYAENKEGFYQKYDCRFTSDGAFFRNTETGKEYFDTTFKCKDLGDSVIHRTPGMDDDKFESMIKEMAIQNTATSASIRGYKEGTKEYDDIKKKEMERAETIIRSVKRYDSEISQIANTLSTPQRVNHINTKIPENYNEQESREFLQNEFTHFLDYGYVSEPSISSTISHITGGRYTTLNKENLSEVVKNLDVGTLETLATGLNTIQKYEKVTTNGAVRRILYAEATNQSTSSYVPQNVDFSGFNNNNICHSVAYIDPETNKCMMHTTSFDTGASITFEAPEDFPPPVPGTVVEYGGRIKLDENGVPSLEFFDNPLGIQKISEESEENDIFQNGNTFNEISIDELNLANATNELTVVKKDNKCIIYDSNRNIVYKGELQGDNITQPKEMMAIPVTLQNGQLQIKDKDFNSNRLARIRLNLINTSNDSELKSLIESILR